MIKRTGNSTLSQVSAEGESLTREAFRRLMANKAAVGSMIVLGVIVVLSFLGRHLLPNGIEDIYWDYIQHPPTMDNFMIFGTDSNGRDILVRTLFGGQISLMVALIAALVSLLVGVIYGAISGYVGGRVDALMMRGVDILYAIPFTFVVILLTVVFGRSILLIFLALGLVEWLDMARIVRGQTLSLKQKEFVLSAKALGVSGWGIIFRHIIPNTLGLVMIYLTLTIPKVILLESFISFLGLGVSEPWTSWGVLISEGSDLMRVAPWLLFSPAAFLIVTMFAFSFVGDGLRDAFDPRGR